MKKKLLIILGVFVGALAIILLALTIVIKSISFPDLIVKQVETMFNVRASIDKFTLRFFPALRVSLIEVTFYPRDSVADQGIPLADRKKPAQKKIIQIPKIDLSIKIYELLTQKKIIVKQFLFIEPIIDIRLSKKGNLNFLPMLSTPKIVNDQPNPNYKSISKEKTPPFDIRNLPIAGLVERMGFERATINFLLELTGNTIKITNLNLILKDIDLDPNNLVDHNSAHLNFDLKCAVFARDKKRTAEINLLSSGDIVPFSAKNGQINPEITYQITILRDSYVSGYGIFDQLVRFTDDLRNFGMKLENFQSLKQKFQLTHDSTLRARFANSKIQTLSDMRLSNEQINLSLFKKSYIHLTTLTQNLSGQFEVLNNSDTQSIFHSFDQKLVEASKVSLPEVQKIRGQYFDSITTINNGKEGIAIRFLATGTISNPKIAMIYSLPKPDQLLNQLLQQRIKEEQKKVTEEINEQLEEKKEELKERAREQLRKQLESNFQ